MDELRELINTFLALDEDALLNEVLSQKETHEFILNLNLQEQLFKKGIDSTGKVLGQYSPTTQTLSKGKKKAGANYTLKDTGDFYKSVFINNYPSYFEIDENYTTFDIIYKYGANILGLTPENLDKLILYITPKLIELILTKLKLN